MDKSLLKDEILDAMYSPLIHQEIPLEEIKRIENSVLKVVDEYVQDLVTLPKGVAEWFESVKTCSMLDTLAELSKNQLTYEDEDVVKWTKKVGLLEGHKILAKAYMDGYTIDDNSAQFETIYQYVVTDGNHCYFGGWNEINFIAVIDNVVGYENDVVKFDDKEIAQDVAHRIGWYVKEVQNDRT